MFRESGAYGEEIGGEGGGMKAGGGTGAGRGRGWERGERKGDVKLHSVASYVKAGGSIADIGRRTRAGGRVDRRAGGQVGWAGMQASVQRTGARAGVPTDGPRSERVSKRSGKLGESGR